jgi:P21-Rho-binding domain
MIQSYTTGLTLYLRNSLSNPIGMPTSFVHRVHVGFNAMTGGFTVGVDSSSHFTDGVFSRVYQLTGKPSSITLSSQPHQPLSLYRRQTQIESLRVIVSPDGSRRFLHPPALKLPTTSSYLRLPTGNRNRII